MAEAVSHHFCTLFASTRSPLAAQAVIKDVTDDSYRVADPQVPQVHHQRLYRVARLHGLHDGHQLLRGDAWRVIPLGWRQSVSPVLLFASISNNNADSLRLGMT
jgi:hypothetical protein